MRYKRAINGFKFGLRGTGKSTWLREAYPGALLIDLLREGAKIKREANPERVAELV